MILPFPISTNPPYPSRIARIVHDTGVDEECFSQIYLNVLHFDHDLRYKVFPPDIHSHQTKLFSVEDAKSVAQFLFELNHLFAYDFKHNPDDYIEATLLFMETFHTQWFTSKDLQIECASAPIISGQTITPGIFDYDKQKWTGFYYELVNHNKRDWSRIMYLPGRQRPPGGEIARARRLAAPEPDADDDLMDQSDDDESLPDVSTLFYPQESASSQETNTSDGIQGAIEHGDDSESQ